MICSYLTKYPYTIYYKDANVLRLKKNIAGEIYAKRLYL